MLLYLQGLGGGSSIDFSSSSSFSSLSPSAAAAATEDEAVNVYRMENSTFAKFPASDVPKIYKYDPGFSPKKKKEMGGNRQF